MSGLQTFTLILRSFVNCFSIRVCARALLTCQKELPLTHVENRLSVHSSLQISFVLRIFKNHVRLFDHVVWKK